MKGVNTQRVIPARGRLLIVQAALTHSIFLKYRKYAVLSWLMGTCTWFLSFYFSLFLWNQRSCFPLLWFNSLNPFLFVCPWYHRRKSCPRGRKTLNNSKKSSQPQWRGDIELAGTWPTGFNSSACFFPKRASDVLGVPARFLWLHLGWASSVISCTHFQGGRRPHSIFYRWLTHCRKDRGNIRDT